MREQVDSVIASLEKMSKPEKKPELSRFDTEINAMAEKMRKEAIDKMAYVENEMIESARKITTETLTMLRKEIETYTKKADEIKSGISQSVSGSINSLRNFTEQTKNRFVKELSEYTQKEMAKNEFIISDLKTGIAKLQDRAVSDIDIKIEKIVKGIESKVSSKIKEIEKIQPKVKEEKLPVVEKEAGKPEHFVDNIHIEKKGEQGEIIKTYKDLENIGERKGDPDELLK